MRRTASRYSQPAAAGTIQCKPYCIQGLCVRQAFVKRETSMYDSQLVAQLAGPHCKRDLAPAAVFSGLNRTMSVWSMCPDACR